MHPQLCDVIRMVKALNLGVELFTNGVLLDDVKTAQLKDAGTDAIFLHIERSQIRPDLPMNPTETQLRACWTAKTRLVARYGMDTGLTLTAREHKLDELTEITQFIIESDATQYLIVTLSRDLPDGLRITGNIEIGLTAEYTASTHIAETGALDNTQIQEHLAQTFGVHPFAYLGSNVDATDPRWLSYHVVTARQRSGALLYQHLNSSGFEKAFVWLQRWLSGRFPMFRHQKSREVLAQLLLNSLTGGGFRRTGSFIGRTLRPGTTYRTKRLLFQKLANVGPSNRIIHCHQCPDAVIHSGQLVPVCLFDKVAAEGF